MDPSTSSGPLCARPVISTPSSTNTPYKLLPLLPADIARCVELYFAALHSPQLISRWPRCLPLDRQWTETAFATELSQPGAHWLKAVIVDGQEQEDHSARSDSDGSSIVAFAKWQECPTGQNPSMTTTTASSSWPAGTDTAACDETLAAWTRAHTETTGAKAHWNLEFLAIDPAYHQGKGNDDDDDDDDDKSSGGIRAAQQLIQWGLERADGAGVDVYVKARPEAVLLFGRFGFWEMGRREKLVAIEKSGREESGAAMTRTTRDAAEGDAGGEWQRDVYMLRYAAGCCA